ncbi:MAG: AgmX/PglI C-terminal domain-containing protein [Deltaproteobacteria bacterium]|nr:AgmX/PglI C-terminal domain-containing protein [Deltaproteobacteria bacterium]
MTSPFRVRVFQGDKMLEERIFNDRLVKLGRHKTAQVKLDDRGAAFVHAVLTTENEEIALTDMSGPRGTFVNGKLIGKKLLVPGDEIRIAGLRILVDRPGAEPPPSPPVLVLEPAPSPVQGQPVTPQDTPAAAGVALGADTSAAAAREILRETRPAPQPFVESAPTSEPRSVLDLEPHFPDRPFGSFVPHEPQPPKRKLNVGRPAALQLSAWWGDTRLQVIQPDEPQAIWMGPTHRCALQAPGAERVLVEPLDGGFALHVDSFSKAKRRRGDHLESLGAGVHALEPGDFAWLETGGLRVEASFVDRPSPAKTPWASRLDYGLLNIILALTFVAAAFAVAVETREETDLVADDLAPHARLAIRLTHPITAKPRFRTDAPELSLETAEREPTRRAPGVEGEAGDPKKPRTHKKMGALGSVVIDTQQLASSRGLLASVQGPNVSGVFGKGGIDSGVIASLGNLRGPSYGAAGGEGGLGMVGRGPGGGGDPHTIGIGRIDLVARGVREGRDGIPSLKRDTKSTPTPEFDDTPPETDGTLDPEHVRRIIRSHVSQIRYCYEQRLVSVPDLAGKVRVRFTVDAQGDVPAASATEGTTINDRGLLQCILSRVRSWKFPSPKGGGSAIVTYPFWLRPSGE